MTKKIKAGLVGATGYAGQQLLWILHQHPNVVINFITSNSYGGDSISDIYGNYKDHYNERLISQEAIESQLSDIDVIFIALPHGLSEKIAKSALEKNVKVIDLGADFRLDDSKVYEAWYKTQHMHPEISNQAIYGLPEINRDQIKKSQVIAVPGCFPTSALLGALPLLKNQLVGANIIVDSKSGISGAGRSAKTELIFAEVNENFKAYAVFSHRHTPEIEQEMSKMAQMPINVLFTPHLLPINRGILSTIYLDLIEGNHTEQSLLKLYKEFYQDHPFVRVVDGLPEIKHVKNSNICEIGLRVDPIRKKVIVISVIDNLIKGASGQAVQCMNLLFDLDEREGLMFLSMYI